MHLAADVIAIKNIPIMRAIVSNFYILFLLTPDGRSHTL